VCAGDSCQWTPASWGPARLRVGGSGEGAQKCLNVIKIYGSPVSVVAA